MSTRDGLPCLLGARRYMVDVGELGWRSIRPTRQGVDQGARDGEQSLSNEVVWRRLRDNWVGGAGQEYADLIDEEDPSSPVRFHTSTDLDPWTRRALTVGRPRVWLGHHDQDVGSYTLTHADLTNLGSTDFWLWVDIPPADYHASVQTVLASNDAFELSIGNQALPDLHLNLAIKLSGSASFTNLVADAFGSNDYYLNQGGTVGVHVHQSGADVVADFYQSSFGAITTQINAGLAHISAETAATKTLNVAGGSDLYVANGGLNAGLAYGSGVTALSTTGATAHVLVEPTLGAGWLTSDTTTTTGIFTATGFAGISATLDTALTATPTFLFPHVTVWDSYDFGAPDDLGYSLASIAGRIVRTYDVDMATGALTYTAASGFQVPSPVRTASGDGAGRTYLTLENGEVWVYTNAALSLSCAQIGTETAEGVAVCAGRLIAWDNADLFELSAAGVRTNIMSAPSASFRWGGAVAAPNGLYAYGAVGVNGVIYYLPISEVDGSVDPGFVAAPLPSDERVQALLPHLGVMVVGTTGGVRLGVTNADGSLSLGPLLELGSVVSLSAVGTDLYAVNAAGGLWRLDPARFTDSLQPAYASEAGTALDLPSSTAAQVDAAADQVIVLATTPTDALVLLSSPAFIYGYPPQTSGAVTRVCAEGSIDMGWFTYGIGEPLALDSILVGCEPHDGSSTWSVTVHVDTPDTDSVLTGTLDFSSGSTLEVLAGSDLRARRFRIRLVLDADAAAGTAPTVREVVLRAAPAPFISDEILLPIVLADDIATEEGREFALNPWDEWAYLIGLRDRRERVAFQFGSLTKTVRIEDLAVQSGGLGGGNGLDGWAADERFVKGRWIARLVTVED